MIIKSVSVILTSCLFFSHTVASSVYGDVKSEAEKIRSEYAERYDSGLSVHERKNMMAEANLELQRLIVEKLAPPWYGTKWAFDGTSQVPGQGGIACGYFVTTLLRDVGIKLDRVRLAQQASENIIKTLISSGSIRRFSNKPLTPFLSNVSEWGYGLYVVGLDYHVGFLSVEPSGEYFIHSSYQSPHIVIRETASKSTILESSKYRVVGKLGDEKLMTGWLKGIKFDTVGI